MELSNGRVEITSYPHGALFKIGEYWEALLSGRVDMIDLFPHTLPGQFRLAEMFMLPFMGVGSSAITSMATYELVNKDFPDVFYPQFEGARVMTTHVTAVCNLHTRDKMVKSLDDLEGMIIAGENPIQLSAIESWGATPEHITMADGYLALERGGIDGGVWPWAPLRSNKFTDFLVNHTIIDIGYATGAYVMNQEKFDSMPDDVKAVMEEISHAQYAALLGYTLSNGSLVDIQWMKEQGHEFFTMPPDERAKLIDVAEEVSEAWFDQAAAVGVDGKALMKRARQIVAEFEANPYPELDWFGTAGRPDSPYKPGG